MPSRWLHDSLLASQRWNDLGHAAQNLYVRLMLVVDDFGCFDGREGVIANACYPTHRVDVTELLQALHAADMIVRYSNAGKPFIALTRWQNDIRGKRRVPAPPTCNESVEALHNLRGKYGRDIGWRNPGGTEPNSTLLDAQMRPTVPQPPEWRLVDKDYAPDLTGVQALRTTGPQPLNTTSNTLVRKPYIQDVDVDVDVDKDKDQTKTQTQTQIVPPAPQHGAQPLQPPPATPTTTPDRIKLNGNGGWHGLSEAQRLRWQSMFSVLSIPDQLDRAAAWLQANPEKRVDIERDGSEHAFLVRWLLREVKEHEQRTDRTRAKTDA